MSLRAILSDLRANRAIYLGELDFPAYPLDGVFTGAGQVRLSVSDSGAVQLLIPVSSSDIIGEYPASDAMEVRQVRYRSYQGKIAFIRLLCLDDSLESVFLDMLENVLVRIREGGGPATCILNAIAEFQALLQEPAARGDRNTVSGLYAELELLHRASARDPGFWKYWSGPSGSAGRRDFRLKGVDVEVKSSVSWHQRVVTISSLEQLSVVEETDLYLWYFRLEENPSDGKSIGDIASELDSLISDPAGFRAKLEAAGYKDECADEWDQWKWNVLESTPFHVEAAFPRLAPELIIDGRPRGIGEVSYKLNLDQAEDCRRDELQMLEQLVS